MNLGERIYEKIIAKVPHPLTDRKKKALKQTLIIAANTYNTADEIANQALSVMAVSNGTVQKHGLALIKAIGEAMEEDDSEPA